MKGILLVCGGGASSGFLAQSVKKAIKERGMDIIVEAVGESEIEEYIDEKDIVLFGPHLKYMEEDLKEILKPYKIPYEFIPEQYYGAINGAGTLEFAIKCTEKGRGDLNGKNH